jgi:hypothetical protein
MQDYFPDVVAVRPFWTRNAWWDAASFAIRWLSRPDGAWRPAEVVHMGIEVKVMDRRKVGERRQNPRPTNNLPDGGLPPRKADRRTRNGAANVLPDGSWLEVHEACVGDDGWRLKPSRLAAWKGHGRKVIYGEWIGADRMDLAGLYAQSVHWASYRRPYDKAAIIGHLIVRSIPGRLLRRLGVDLRVGGDSTKVICSEGGSILLWEYSVDNWLDLRTTPGQPWADVTPQSALMRARALELVRR